MTFPDRPSHDKVVRFRESELRTYAQFWHADPTPENADLLRIAVERWQEALIARDEAVQRGEEGSRSA